MVIWITGRPGSGKTTFGRMLRELIVNSILLDGDELRLATEHKDFTKEGRDKWVLLVAGIASVLERENKIPIICLVSPYSQTRQEARKKFKNSILFYIKKKGDEENMWPGSDYEEPIPKEKAFKLEPPVLPKDVIKMVTGREPKKEVFRVEVKREVID